MMAMVMIIMAMMAKVNLINSCSSNFQLPSWSTCDDDGDDDEVDYDNDVDVQLDKLVLIQLPIPVLVNLVEHRGRLLRGNRLVDEDIYK